VPRRRLMVVLVVYVIGFIGAFFVGAVMRHGLESSAHEVLPFLLAYDCLFGLLVGGAWLLVLPAFYYFGIELLVSLIKNGGSGTATFDRTEFAFLGTLFIALGIGGNALWRRLRIGER
jgi:hypothetical protein